METKFITYLVPVLQGTEGFVALISVNIEVNEVNKKRYKYCENYTFEQLNKLALIKSKNLRLKFHVDTLDGDFC